MIAWSFAAVPAPTLAAVICLAAPASAIELAQAPASFAQPRLAQAQPAKPGAPAQKPAQRAAAVASGEQPKLLGQFGDWGAYTASPGGRKVCFALAKPTSAQTDPPNRPRDPAYIFISSRPADNVKNEVSVMFGYAFKPNAEASLEIAGTRFAMYTQSDGGWIKNAAEEQRLVESMRKASDLTVKGVSSRNTSSADIYSLKGLAQALDRTAQECR